ncbi:hypothetical protein FRC12_017384 [Ceratobasidium sp. 428]|nr:hypothetical protein FRC12_017384 [Ceratobasidium sp. 428]
MVLWLERAGGAPILNFHATPQDAEDVDPQLYDILRPHMSRAVSLTFSRVGIVHAQDILNLYAACRPPGQLQVLSITGTIPHYSSTDWFGWPIRSLPGLTVLELFELSVQVCPNMDELVWMLSNSPALHTLRLVGASGIEYQDYPRIILPNLKYVEISPISSSARYYGILKALVPGNLALHVRVWLALSGCADKDGLSAFIAFLNRSNTVHLYFIEPGFSRLGSEYLEVLDSVPHLQFLSFEPLGAPQYSMNTPTALGKIFEGTGPHVRRNGLRVLHVQHMSMDQSMWDRMQQVIETRQPEKIIIGLEVRGLDDIVESGQGTKLDWLRERVGLVVHGEHVELPIDENLS